ncbi:LEM-3-like GIY-YIG domain-containing protein [Helicobacter sp. 23-1045]
MTIDRFSNEVCEKLGHYVYGLIDPRNGRYFYIGKGQGNRIFQHIKEAQNMGENAEKDKHKIINQIKQENLEVMHLILRHGLSAKEAEVVEATLIDFYGLEFLTNEQSGADSDDYGIARAETLQKVYSCEEFSDCDKPPFIMIKIKQRFLDERGSYYETCRYAWKISPEKAKDRFVLCVMDGIVKEVFEVEKWQESNLKGRYEFNGEVARQEIRELFINKRIPEHYRTKGMANPVLYSKNGGEK